MLNQLVESKNHTAENTRKNGFLVGTLGVLVAVLVSGWTYSLFAKNFGMGAGDLELSSIVAPVAVVDDAPPPKPEIKPQSKPQSAPSSKIILKALYDDVSSSKNPPKDLSGEREVVSATKYNLSDVKLGDVNQIPGNVSGRTGAIDTEGCGLCPGGTEDKSAKKDEDEEKELVVKSTPKPTPPKPPVVQTLGVVNGKATYLAKPPYPPTAKMMNIAGAVNVQVTIDEKGNVISASVVSGHPLLRPGAENAARQSKFTPTLLSNQPVKVTGVIVYQFKP